MELKRLKKNPVNIYMPEWKEHVLKNIRHKYADKDGKINGWDDYRVQIEIEEERFKLTWNRSDIHFDRLKEDGSSFLFLKGVVDSEPIYDYGKLKRERIIGIPNVGEVIVQSDRGTEYKVKKSINYWINMREIIEKTPGNAMVWALIDTKLSPWEFVKIEVEMPEQEEEECDPYFKNARTVITGC
jgi:hypothetical protein